MKSKIYISLIILILIPNLLFSQSEKLVISAIQDHLYSTDNYNFGGSTKRNFYIISYDENGRTDKKFQVSLSYLNLIGNTNYSLTIRLLTQLGGNIVHTETITTNSTGTVAVSGQINSSDLTQTGIFEIIISDISTNNTVLSFPNTFLVIEKAVKYTFSGCPMDFKIHYAESFFVHTSISIPDYLTLIKNEIKNSWELQIDQWGLARDLSNTLRDNDNIYRVYLGCLSIIPKTVATFHKAQYNYMAWGGELERAVFIDCQPSVELTNPTRAFEEEFIGMAIAHEFFHGIQWSYVSQARLQTSHAKTDYSMWVIEGQAKFLETVIPTVAPNPKFAYRIKHSSGSYDMYSSEFLNESYGTPYKAESLWGQSYWYALFWRHLYENNFDKNANPAISDKDKLAILKETCKAYEYYMTTNLGTIKTFMTDELKKAGGKFKSFDEALFDFTEKAYFHDNQWKDKSGNLIKNWDDPNSNNFYSTILLNTGFAEPVSLSCNSSTTMPNIISSKIYKSFAFRAHKVETNNINYQTKSLKFNATPDANGNKAEFLVQYHTFNPTTHTITNSEEIKLTNGVGQKHICHAVGEDFVVLVTRIDPNESITTIGSYEITWDNALPAPSLNFVATQSTSDPLTILFANQSTNATGTWLWDFGDGETSTDENPTHTYKHSGTFSVSLKHTACSDVVFTKNNYINILPPYIESVAFYQNSQGLPSKEFNRLYHTPQNKWIFVFDNNFETTEDADIEVKVKTSLPLKSLKLELSDVNTLIYEPSIVPSQNARVKEWTFIIPKEKLLKGFHSIKFSGKDFADVNLIKVKDPVKKEVVIDETQVGWSSTDIAAITGVDDNYQFVIEGNVSNDPKDFIDISLKSKCDEGLELTIVNYGSLYITIMVDNTSYPGVQSGDFTVVTLANPNQSYTLKLSEQKQINGVWTQVLVLSKIIGYSNYKFF